MPPSPFDILIIGSGGGTKLAQPAAALGRRVALVEADAFGGTCLNRGCIPSKMMIYPAEVATLAREAARLGIAGTGEPQIDFRALVERIQSSVAATSTEQRGLHTAHANLSVFDGHARFLHDRVIEVAGVQLEAQQIFIASGTRPHVPDIPGLAGTPFMTSTDALRNTKLPKRLLVLGGGYIAAELGFAYGAFGSAVELFVRGRMLRHEDTEIAAEFTRVFARHHTMHLGFTIERVTYADGTFTVHGTSATGESLQRTGDALLVATGVTPNTDMLDLEKTSIRCNADGFVTVDEHLQTTAPGVYALGDCIGRHLFRHTVNYEGEYLLRTAVLRKDDRPLDYGPVPRAVFSHPQVAAVGATEDDLRARGVDVIVGRATYAESTPGEARLLDHGLVKILVAPQTGRLLGAHIVGEEASNMIHLFIALMKKSGTLDDLLDMIFIHPALPEVARNAGRDAARQRR